MATTEQLELQQDLHTQSPDTPNDGNDTTAKPVLTKTDSEQMLSSMAVEEDALKELKFARFIVKCPCLLCIMILIILMLICVVDAALFEFTTDGERTYFPNPPDKYVDGLDGFLLASESITFEDENETNSITQAEEEGYFMFQMFFTLSDYKDDFDEDNPEKTDYWILTPEHIKTIIKWEDKIVSDPEWLNRFCFV